MASSLQGKRVYGYKHQTLVLILFLQLASNRATHFPQLLGAPDPDWHRPLDIPELARRLDRYDEADTLLKGGSPLLVQAVFR